MLILDYQRWRHRDIPVLFSIFVDKNSPCFKTQCIITPTCSKECNPFQDFLYIRISETVSYLRERIGTIRYKNEVEISETYHAGKITEALLKLYDPKLKDAELEITMSRYFYCMKRAWAISSRRAARTGVNPNNFYIQI